MDYPTIFKEKEMYLQTRPKELFGEALDTFLDDMVEHIKERKYSYRRADYIKKALLGLAPFHQSTTYIAEILSKGKVAKLSVELLYWVEYLKISYNKHQQEFEKKWVSIQEFEPKFERGQFIKFVEGKYVTVLQVLHVDIELGYYVCVS